MSNLDTTDNGDESLIDALGVFKTSSLEIKGSGLHFERATPIFMELVKS